MLDLKALKSALAVIGNVGKDEFTFDVDGIPVTMHVLTADEDFAVTKYAREGVGEDGQEEETDAQTLLERFKRASLAHSIVQVGSVDLRNEDYIATGEVTESGMPIRIHRTVAVRKIIDDWTRTATTAMFQKYLEMIQRADAKAEKAVKFDPEDLDTEIARCERRLAELKAEKERAAALRSGSTLAEHVGDADKANQTRFREAIGDMGNRPTPTLPNENEPETPPVQAKLAAPAPVLAQPPVQPPARQRVGPPVTAPLPPPTQAPAPVVLPPAATPMDGGFDSMQDSMGDSPEALAAETARLMAARAALRRQAPPQPVAQAQDEEADLPDAIETPIRHVAPHRAALNATRAAVAAQEGNIKAHRVSGPGDDIEAMRLPSAPLSEHSRKAAPKKVVVDMPENVGPTNPRFRSGRR